MTTPATSDDHTTLPTVTRGPGCVTVTVHGDLDHTAAARLRELLFDPTICDQPTVVVDLSDVNHIESTAIGGLVAARRWHQTRNTALPLVIDPESPLNSLFATAPLATIFDIRSSVDTPRPSAVRPRMR